MKIGIIIVMILHALIHLLGFVKAFNFAEISELTIAISRSQGVLWLGTGILFLVATSLLFLNSDFWWKFAIVAVIVSQFLIVWSWGDAKVGTIANVFIALVILFALSASRYEQQVEEEIERLLNQGDNTTRMVTE